MPSTLYRDAALADGRSARLRLGVCLLTEDGLIAGSGQRATRAISRPVRDHRACGSTIVPGIVDATVTLRCPAAATGPTGRRRPHGAAARGRRGQRRAVGAGSGSAGPATSGRPRRRSPGRAPIGRSRSGCATPGGARTGYVRAAGTWVMPVGLMPPGRSVEAATRMSWSPRRSPSSTMALTSSSSTSTVPIPDRSPWSVAEVRRVVEALHARGARITAHATSRAPGGRCARGGNDPSSTGSSSTRRWRPSWRPTRRPARVHARRACLVADLPHDHGDVPVRLVGRHRSGRGRRELPSRRVAPGPQRRVASRPAPTRWGLDACQPARLGGGAAGGSRAGAMGGAGRGDLARRGAARRTRRGPDRVGGPADLVLVHGDPLSDPAALWRVWRVAGIRPAGDGRRPVPGPPERSKAAENKYLLVERLHWRPLPAMASTSSCPRQVIELVRGLDSLA